MASDKAITNAIMETVRKLFKTDLDALSVNHVRKIVEEQLDLSPGFLKGDAWKAKSKELITSEVAKLDEGTSTPESPAPAPKPKSKPEPQPKVTKKNEPVKKGTKRAAPAKAAAPKKRQKKEVTPSSSDEELSEPESEPEQSEEEAEFSDSDVSEAPRPTKRAGGGPWKKGKKEEMESEEESEAEETPSDGDSDVSEAPKKKGAKPKAKPKAKPAPRRASTASRKSSEKVVSENEEEEEVASPIKLNPVVVAKSKPLHTVETSDAEDDEKPDTTNQAAEDSDSDLSVLINEPPKRSKSSSKSTKPSTSKTPKPAAALSPANAEIKTLQSQLVKCGIRKIWQFELKDYGDDSKAKTRHLKNMLKEVGMEGRFSEARAREIKEMRELAQDVEAVTEGATLWGKRGRRSGGKKVVSQEVESGSEEESEEEDRPARRAARKDDLAFLGDESESD